jgi:hypothetical protein
MRVPGVSSNLDAPSSSELTLGAEPPWFCARLRTKMMDASFRLFCCACEVCSAGDPPYGAGSSHFCCVSANASERCDSGWLRRYWFEMSLVVRGSCPPDIAWPKLPAAVVWRWGAHGVHHRRHAALGRLRNLLLGLLRRLPHWCLLLRILKEV